MYGMAWYVKMLCYVMVWYDILCYVMSWYGIVCYGMLYCVRWWYGMVWYGVVWYGMVWIVCMDCVYECMHAWKYACKMGEARDTFSRNLESHIMQDSPQSTVDTVDTERVVLQDQASRTTTCQQLLPQSSLTRQTVCSRKRSAVCFVAHILWSRPVTQVGRLWRRWCSAIWCDVRNAPTYIINTSIQSHSCMQYAYRMYVLFSDVWSR